MMIVLPFQHWSLIVIVSMITTGLFLFVYKSTSFHLLGFVLCLSASALSGARWTLSQMVMQRDALGLENPIDMMYHIQPIMLLTMLPLAAVFEGTSIRDKFSSRLVALPKKEGIT